jgi:hypothetical protein
VSPAAGGSPNAVVGTRLMQDDPTARVSYTGMDRVVQQDGRRTDAPSNHLSGAIRPHQLPNFNVTPGIMVNHQGRLTDNRPKAL